MVALVSTKFQRQQQQQRRRKRQGSRVLISIAYSAAVVATVYISSIESYWWNDNNLGNSDNNNNNNNNNNSKKFLLEADAFTIKITTPYLSASSTKTHLVRRSRNDRQQIYIFSSVDDQDASNDEHISSSSRSSAVRVPLKYIGPYPCMALKFPNLATESQRSRVSASVSADGTSSTNQTITGISLDFVMDTAANINTIQGQVALELQLEKLVDSPALPGVSSSGPMAGGETYMLGDSQLEEFILLRDTEDEGESSNNNSIIKNEEDNGNNIYDKPFEFMQNLTAAVIPVVNPGSAGLLGLAFFYCFEGGVEFRWGGSMAAQQQQQITKPKVVDGIIVQDDGAETSTPSVTFYGDTSDDDSDLQRALSELTCVIIDPIPLTQLPSVKIKINDVEMMALLDTGSPVTVLNERAAKVAGIHTIKESIDIDDSSNDNDGKKKKNSWNPFSSVVDKFKEAQASAEASSRGDILMIGGIDGKQTSLYRSTDSYTSISLVGSSGEDVAFGE